MPYYPISLSVSSRMVRKFGPTIAHHCAKRIRDYVNEQAEEAEVTVLEYGLIGAALGIDKRIVKECLAPLGGGQTGITIRNRDSR